jgi:GxxExxY protein
MNTDEHRIELDRITKEIISCGFRVSSTLGCGFLEKIYENALALELRKAGLKTDQQHGIAVQYDGTVVGEYAADLLVEGKVIVELKAVKTLDDVHLAQCMNYLKATRLSVCLLLNFGRPKLEVKRVVQDF